MRNAALYASFKGTSFTQIPGLTPDEAGAVDREHICELYDESVPVTERLRIAYGLLLRSDVHTLYDRGYLAVDPSYRLIVSPRLREEFGNGRQFYERAGHQIALPRRQPDRPRREALGWHLDEVFLR